MAVSHQAATPCRAKIKHHVRGRNSVAVRDPSDYLRLEATRLRVPAGRPPTHSIVTITARRGFTLFGRTELPWFEAWRYANVLVDAFTADHILVTEHGWVDLMSGLAGRKPALSIDLG